MQPGNRKSSAFSPASLIHVCTASRVAVAGLLAEQLARPDTQAATAALAQLARDAVDLGEPGRDLVYGLGLVGEAARTAPERVAARRP